MTGFVVALQPTSAGQGAAKAVGPFGSETEASEWARGFNSTRVHVDGHAYCTIVMPIIASGRLCPCGCATPMPQSFADHSAASVQAMQEASRSVSVLDLEREPIEPDYCGCCGGLGTKAPKGEHGRCCGELHDAPADPFAGIPNADDEENARI